MTDYRFVSAPEVVLKEGSGVIRRSIIGTFPEMQVKEMYAKGIIEPVPVEIPEYVVEAAVQAYKSCTNAAPYGFIRAALIAAKQAEEAGA